MKQPSMNLYEFHQRFPDNDACREYLFQKRWPKGYVCPKCGHTEYYEIATRHLYECQHCHYQASVTAGTIMHKTQIPLMVWFWIIFLISKDKRGISALQLSREFPISYPTAWAILHKIRAAMKRRDDSYILQGIIEVDDSYFGGKTEGKRGRGTTRTPVLVALSKRADGKPGFIKMEPLQDLTQETIHGKIVRITEGSSIIKSDEFSSYDNVPDRTHIGIRIFGSDLSTVLRWVHTAISNAKAFIRGTYHGVGIKHLQEYLSEFCYRFNRRWWQNQLFDRLVVACVNADAIKYTELI